MTARCDVCWGPLVPAIATARAGTSAGTPAASRSTPTSSTAGPRPRSSECSTRPDVLERLMPEAVDEAALAAARDEVARVQAEHADLIAQVAAGKLSATLAAGAEPGILARLQLAEAKVQELTTPAGLRQLIDPGPKVVERWEEMPMSARREVVRLLFAPVVLGVLSIAPSGGSQLSVRERIRLDGKALPRTNRYLVLALERLPGT